MHIRRVYADKQILREYYKKLGVPEDKVDNTVFSLACIGCDAGDNISDPWQAKEEGWVNIEYNEGMGWNFLGYCPHCKD
jgi:hypothetical protein